MDTSESSSSSSSRTDSSSSSPSECDRRLSRAAREILRRDVLPILRHYVPSSSISSKAELVQQYKDDDAQPSSSSSSSPIVPVKPLPDHPYELISILSALLHSNNNNNNCPLDPRLDMHLPHELQSHLTKKLGGRYKSHLHQCGICRKNFVSQYYLDHHMQTHHPSLETTTSKICPASDLCPSIGGHEKCAHIAYEIEPYYAPGSGGNSLHDAKKVMSSLYTLLQSSIQPCVDADMLHLQQSCTNLFRTCFESQYPEMTRDIVEHVCVKYGSGCRYRIHEYAGLVRYTVHHWRDVWMEHHDFGMGYRGVIVLVVLCGFYVGVFLGCFGGGGGRGWLYDWVIKSVRSGGTGNGKKGMVRSSGRRMRGGLPDRTSRQSRTLHRRKEKAS